MKKTMKRLGWIFGGLLLLVLILGIIAHERKPMGVEGPEAEALARQMMDAVDTDAWKDTDWIRWTFAGQHHYVWDKDRDLVKVNWDNYEVWLDTRTQQGEVQQLGLVVDGDKRDKALEKAWNYFCNDSYWLNPIAKAFDPGTSRHLVPLENGDKGIMITHSSGGTTPGDSYLYILDSTNRPMAWKMWVGIIPIGGIKVSWEGWQEIKGGAYVSTKHGFLGKTFTMISDLDAGNRFDEVGLEDDPFDSL